MISLVCKDLTKLDYAYFDRRFGPAGDSLSVDAELFGTQDQDGFIFDFSYAKKSIKQVIDEVMDHTFVVHQDFVTKISNEQFCFEKNGFKYVGPKEAFCLLDFKINNSSLERFLEAKIMAKMPKNVKAVKIILRSEKNSEANYYFRYTHGLKNHYGNCQRLFHGHRSTVMIWVDGERSPVLEKYLVTDCLKNTVHFVYWENVVNKAELSATPLVGRYSGEKQVVLKYTSSQGEFLAELPSKICYFLDQETSIENLSQHFVKTLETKLARPQKIMLYLCEGIGKGATCSL